MMFYTNKPVNGIRTGSYRKGLCFYHVTDSHIQLSSLNGRLSQRDIAAIKIKFPGRTMSVVNAKWDGSGYVPAY